MTRRYNLDGRPEPGEMTVGDLLDEEAADSLRDLLGEAGGDD